KRLCGKIVDGQNPGSPLALADLGSAQVDQWYIACSAGGQTAYPYGATMKPGACNLGPSGPGARRPPGSYTACFGGSPGISDMLGNVWEWIDYCFQPADAGTLPENSVCYSRGGGFGSTEDQAKCDYNGTLARRTGKNSEIGIRCCSL
ncbi:MAG TPA: SUMF1/EgtB/PvdO family nonheme iron enzyme, partial [Labilithrix sp.]|nr:SUMF1/EgtB/PvdO family nonheme iron enzyme [Labilithrix sp.]